MNSQRGNNVPIIQMARSNVLLTLLRRTVFPQLESGFSKWFKPITAVFKADTKAKSVRKASWIAACLVISN